MNETKVYLDKFKFRSYQIPVADALENKKIKRLIICWPRRCLSGESHILLHDGSFKLLRDILVGDKIMSWDGTGFVTDTVKHVWSTEVKKTIKVSGSRCYLPLISSEDHVFASSCSTSGYVTWKPIKDITSTRSLLQYAGSNHGTVDNPDLAAFWGYLLSDGYVVSGQQPKFTNTNKDILERVCDLTFKLFGYTAIWRPKGNGFDLGLSNGCLGGGTNKIMDLFRSEEIDVPKSVQRLPKSIWNFTEDSLLYFFSALISSDGNIYCHDKGFTANDKRGRSVPPAAEITVSCGSSYNYAFDLYWLLRKIGIVPQKPYLERGSNWKIKVAKSNCIKKLLSKPIHGKFEAQDKALKLIESRYNSSKIHNGCYKTIFKTEPSEDLILYDIETETHHNFVANGFLVHNSGKDLTAFNLCVRQCLKRVGTIFYVFPTFSSGRRILWDAVTNEGRRILDFIPPELIESKNEQQMRIRFVNGSQICVIGSDNYDQTLVGVNAMGIVFSEYALSDPMAYQYARPILTANDGWALIISTPRGKNFFWDLFNIAQHNPQTWFCERLTVNDTKHINMEEIQRELDTGEMSEDLIQQEYFCSFDMGVEGAYYSKYIDRMRLKGQIGEVPWEASHPVHTAWDIGVRDSCVILMFQIIGHSVKIIDCYENSKVGLEHYIKILDSKPYKWGKHVAPHDIAVKEFGSGMTRLEKAKNLGINFIVAPRLSIEDGIESVRSLLSKVWIDQRACKTLIKAIENYRQEYDHKRKVYSAHPLHDWSSNYADSLRYLAVTAPRLTPGTSAEELDKRYKEAMYGEQNNLPHFFKDNNGF